MKIRLNDIRLFARHGVMPDEQTIGAWFRVSLCATIGSDSAAITDNLDETINYAMMADIVKEEMQVPSKLIEHVAGRIGRRLMDELPLIESLEVKVTKENPPISMECRSASVELSLQRKTTS